MNLRHEFNRIGDLVYGGAGKAQKTAGTWIEKRGNGVARRVRDQAGTQARSIVTVEEKIAEHIRKNPGLYVIGIALALGAIFAKVVIESREARRAAPLL